MTERLNVTTSTGEGAAFEPGGDFTVQVEAEYAGALFDVLGRVDAAASWLLLGTLQPADRFARFADIPFAKIAVRENIAGKSAKAWTSV